MRNRDRFLRLVMTASAMVVLGAPVFASAGRPAAGSAATYSSDPAGVSASPSSDATLDRSIDVEAP